MESRIIAADWILPISRPAIRDGAIVIDDGRIAWIGRLAALQTAHRQLPVERHRGILTPGLVNAHTHLQYTGFATLGRGDYRSFEDWSESFEHRYEGVREPDEWYTAARDGARFVLSTGTTYVAEIVTDDSARGALSEAGLGGVEYLEAIGQTSRIWNECGRSAFSVRLDSPSKSIVGVSPHAPYSLDGAVVRELAALARERGMRLHSHVAESSVESSLYTHGDHTVLEIYGDLRDEFELVRSGGTGHLTARYAESIGLLGPDSHLAHGIYLDREERDLIRTSGTRVALCPRSNRVIGLDPPNVAAYLDEGHDIAVGTDSLASSPSLDLLGDVRELADLARTQGYRSDDLYERLIHAATRGGARALGLSTAGAIEPAYPADLALFQVGVTNDPYRALVEHGEGHCRLTVVGGQTRFRHPSCVISAANTTADSQGERAHGLP